MKTEIRIAATALQEFAKSLLCAGGFGDEESDITARSLVLSNLLGYDSHGVIRISEYLHYLGTGEVVSNATLEILKESPATILADGGRGLGQVQMPAFINHLLPKAKICGVAAGGLANCGHAGRIGEWVEIIATEGLAALVTINDNGTFRCVAPPGGRTAVTSTNPFAFAAPSGNSSVFAFDTSTSGTAMGKVRLAHIAGEFLPDGLVQDSEGRATRDPGVLFADPPGSLLPMGGVSQGYKGFGLSMVVDCLTAGLSGGFSPPAPDGAPLVNNVSVTIWNPAFFAGVEHMKAQIEKYTSYVRSSAPANPDRPVRVAGDRAAAEKTQRLKNGIPVEINLAQKLIVKAQKLGVSVPRVFEKID